MTRKTLDKYRNIVGDKTINEIYESASSLSEKHIVHINSTYQGGGVAEILETLVLLMNDAGVDTGWRLLHGSLDFFTVTKKFHNALQGDDIRLSRMKRKIYEGNNENNAAFLHLDHDAVIVHDPQPLPLIKFEKKSQPWIWRCHIDISNPNEVAWNYLKKFILKYDAMVVSMEEYKKNLPIKQRVIMPAIDPLSPKNHEISASKISKYLSKFGIEQDKPIISQVSRFDKWKDPEGVIKAYEIAKKKVDCRLVLIGSIATDDPEGQRIYDGLRKRIEDENDILLISHESDILVNAIQRASSIILQKSIKEGFGLTMSEALWKCTPVIGGNVGGIRTQVIEGINGYLVDDIKECADRIVKLLENPKLAEEMGKKGKEHVRNNFLVTRHLLDWFEFLKLYLSR
ncbi:MAG: glycosyltransferase [Candidatus Altiarchaeales archaeon]|nr:glycosyltransferase [Candidatus Altiarchaeota archaeon]MCG2782850.1 glycosyltransferase [Candidatus Altiarchaeales archaeon]MBU4266976.1 glycosyltransferase [Candidatus Altiarchaeota archaeon]MBU4342134.1 glycosyltransferase [Candidatus Altiarchaeota archaeon]MBU4406397.1 glycosyltransferase [Candidatus Altiarchaeota archaeon]